MDNKQLHEAVQNAVKSSFRGKQVLKSRTIPLYPDSAEREMQRLINSVTKIAKEELRKRLPEIMREYQKAMRKDSRYDSDGDFDRTIRKIFEEIAIEISNRVNSLAIVDRVAKISTMARNLVIREWKRSVRKTMGIDIMSDYYKGSFYSDMIRKWIDDNVTKIKTAPASTLDKMRSTILDSYLNGRTIRTVQKDIQKEYDVSKSKAKFWARDQIGSLNAQITESQQRDAGVKKYVWSTSGDRRVRECHRELDGKVISWDDPPEMWYMTKSKGKVYTGRRCHPGQDYICRCVALPVFDYDTINVPMVGDKK